jgi:hypothetical protein
MDHELATIELSQLERAAFEPPKMTIFEATMIAEGNFEIAGYEPDEETSRQAWQLLIDTGTCWQLQGWFGRQAVALIEAGVCTR